MEIFMEHTWNPHPTHSDCHVPRFPHIRYSTPSSPHPCAITTSHNTEELPKNPDLPLPAAKPIALRSSQ